MTAAHAIPENFDQPGFYELRVKGHLDSSWAEWFAGLTITLEDNGETRLAGLVADQAALHSLLRKVRDLGLPLLAVRRVDPGQAESPAGKT